jgi:ABC-type polysaccharide/polyol phosphate transport system ATPase subunit
MALSIKVSNVTKSYDLFAKPTDRLLSLVFPTLFNNRLKRFSALSDISFEVNKGECFGILGVNGAGKSTLLQVIAGILTPNEGEVEVNGEVSALLELGAGFNADLSGLENIYLTGRLKGMTEAEIDSKLDSVLSFADIGDFIHQPVKTYSSGMYMRVAFSANSMNEPEILIVDEALAVGDVNFQKKCMKKFYEIKESGATILFVSHDSYQVRQACSRAILLDKGKLIAHGSSDSVVSEYQYLLENNSRYEGEKLQNSNVDSKVEIVDVQLVNEHGQMIQECCSGDSIKLVANIKINDLEYIEKLTFVVNLYRHDDLYICGTTTAMEHILPFNAHNEMKVEVEFPKIPLLAGRYKWRFAVNDENGLGIYTEMVPVCEFKVQDNFEAVGVINLNRNWHVS